MDKNSDFACNFLFKKFPNFSAKYSHRPILIFLIFLLLLFLFFPYQSIWCYIFIGNITYTICSLSKIFLFYFSLKEREETHFHSDWPVYTILIPMFKESKVVPHLISAINKIDYPKEKLDIKFIVESDDRITKQALEDNGVTDYISVPYSIPQTKPKACNYALSYAKGKYVTIYDADDCPDPLQLKKALSIFSNYPDVACVQACLGYYNKNFNLLTNFFEIEYMSYFGFYIKGLGFCNMPIPLSGSSNHFVTNVLRKVGGWDPFNVTEDADLGFRLYRLGFKVLIMNSYTFEESPFRILAWLKQRSRWIKGFIQTTVVHCRDFFCSKKDFICFLCVNICLLFPVLSFILAPIICFSMLCGFKYFYYYSLFNLFFGWSVVLFIALFSIFKFSAWSMLYIVILYPFYFILHTFAAYRALFQLLINPWYWDKTDHGSL